MLISDEYRALNRELHAREPSYGTSGYKWAGVVKQLAAQIGPASSVLDYGCGRSTLRAVLGDRSCEFREYDPAIPGKDGRPQPADLVACTDVLEHIEPWCLHGVLDDLRGLAKAAVLLVVATRPAKKTLADGRNAHLIVQPIEWWLPKLMDYWAPRQINNFGGEFLFIGGVR